MSLLQIISARSDLVVDPTLWARRLPAALADRAPSVIETDGGLVWSLGGKTAPLGFAAEDALRGVPSAPARSKLEALQWLASFEGRTWLQGRDEVQGEVLYSAGGVWTLINGIEDRDFVLACYRAYNDWLAELSSQDPDAVVGLARIPVTGLADAVAELERAGGDLKLRGAIIDAWPDGFDGAASGATADPFWEAAAGLNMPISIHQQLNGRAEAPEPVDFGRAPSYGFDLNNFVYGNVFERYPNLRLVSAGGTIGWAPIAFEGGNEVYMRTAAMRQFNLADDLMPADHLRRHIWYVIQDDRFGMLNRSYFGDAHVMWGTLSLSPDATVWPNSRQLFERHMAGMPEATRRVLAGDVVSRLYGLKGAAPFSEQELNRYDSYALL